MNPLSRRSMLAGAPAIIRGAARPERPNVLLVLTDDQRKDTVAALGNPHIHTPNLDSLVGRGVSFRNAYCMGGFSAAVCLPSRMMLLRGRSWFSVQKRPEPEPNLPLTMRQAGYLTYHIGKKGNEDLKVHPSFEINRYVEPDDERERLAGTPGKQQADRTVEFLRRWRDDAAFRQGRPFFAYLAGPAPHDPRIAPPEYLARYEPSRIPLPRNFRPFHPFDNGEMTIRDEKLAGWPRTPDEIRRHLRDYYAVVTYMDEQLGRIFDALREIGQERNTYVVFTSDQGIAVGSHGLMGKQNLYEPSMCSPLVVAGPGVPRGRSVDGFAYLFDIYPTICDLAGVRAPESLEGRSQAGVARGRETSVRETVFLAYRDVQRAVRRGRWKLIWYPKVNRAQLFDLEADPDETRNLAEEPAQAGRVGELFALMRSEQRVYGDTLALERSAPSAPDITEEFFRGK